MKMDQVLRIDEVLGGGSNLEMEQAFGIGSSARRKMKCPGRDHVLGDRKRAQGLSGEDGSSARRWIKCLEIGRVLGDRTSAVPNFQTANAPSMVNFQTAKSSLVVNFQTANSSSVVNFQTANSLWVRLLGSLEIHHQHGTRHHVFSPLEQLKTP